MNELNKEQREAVTYDKGPVLVLAGAGSGKTKVLTTRIAYLIKNGISPYNILAITFTNKAAKEMKERVEKAVGEDIKGAQISTFHSFGLKLIMRYADHLGFDRNISILDASDSEKIIKKLINDLGFSDKIYRPKSVKTKISNHKNGQIDIYKEDLDNLGKIYDSYQTILKESNSLDFDDLLLLPLELMEDEEILEELQERYQYILVDEYQDTNNTQYQMIKKLASKYKNFFVVGDADQSIYSFRGANFRNILNFQKDYPEAKIIKLEQNYRSTTNILNAANSVISHNSERHEKNLWSGLGEGAQIIQSYSMDDIGEAHSVAMEIQNLTSEYNYKDIAVLYRINSIGKTLEKELNKYSIPVKLIGSTGFYSRKEVKDLFAYLKLVINSNDNISLLRVLNFPRRQIGPKKISDLERRSNIYKTSLYDSLGESEYLFKAIIEDLKDKEQVMTLSGFVEYAIRATGLYDEYNDSSLEGDLRIENLKEVVEQAQIFEEEYKEEANLKNFLLEKSLFTDEGEKKNDDNRVSLMTMHSAKGLEFKVVFLVGMEEKIIPHAISLDSSEELEEERRLCYVAITRAKEKLYILRAKERTMFGKKLVQQPSRFLSEMEFSGLIKKDKEASDNYRTDEVDYQVGDNVFHEIFGKGIVRKVRKDLLDIEFKKPYNVKTISKKIKKLNKF